MSTPAAPRLRVGVVGAGRVGSVLGAALARARHEIVGVTAVSQESRRRAARFLPDVPIIDPDELVASVDLVLLAVPDDALRPLVAGLAAADAWRSGQIVAHTSGAQGISVLDPAAARGVAALALHPVMTFTGRPEDLDRLNGAAFGVTADEGLRVLAEAVVLDMGGEPVWVPERARALYHAALSVGSNHLVTVVNDALELLAQGGIESGPRLIAPLLSASLDNVLRLGDAALTGPVSRGDTATVAAHLEVLTERAPALVDAYRANAWRTAERAHAADRIGDAQLEALRSVLMPS